MKPRVEKAVVRTPGVLLDLGAIEVAEPTLEDAVEGEAVRFLYAGP
jgi:hypothetical protein